MDTNVMARTALDAVKYAPYWLDAEGKPSDQSSISGQVTCDLLIVGAGFTGLWAAIQAKDEQADRNVVIIEAKSVANGASGRRAAIV